MELTHDEIEKMPYAKLMIKRITRRNARIAEEKARQEAAKRNGQPSNPFLNRK